MLLFPGLLRKGKISPQIEIQSQQLRNESNPRKMASYLARLSPEYPGHWYYPIKIRSWEDVKIYSLYCVCTLRVDECWKLIHTKNVATDLADAAWVYILAFIDLFAYCRKNKRWDDEFMLKVIPSIELSPLEYFYPHPERGFHEGDLPDLFVVMIRDIVGFGDQKEFSNDMGSMMQKCMPFAGQRRNLYGVIEPATLNKSFWRVFSRIMWCMLMGTYPGSKDRPSGKKALLFYNICSRRDLMVQILKPIISQKANRSCTVVFTAFRLYMGYMALENDHFIQVCQFPNWKAVWDDSMEMARKVRASTYFAPDLLSDARLNLENHIKNAKPQVFRYRKNSLTHKLADVFSKCIADHVFLALEKSRTDLYVMRNVLRCLEEGKNHRDLLSKIKNRTFVDKISRVGPQGSLWDCLQECISYCRIQIKSLGEPLDSVVKNNILNLVVEMPYHLWYDIRTFRLLTMPEYGSLHPDTPSRVFQIVDLALNAGMPRKIDEQVSYFDSKHIRVLAWYWNCVKIMDQFHIAPLDAIVTEKIDLVMKKNCYTRFPGLQELSDDAFTVFVTVCCQRIRCEKSHSIGKDDVRFDETICDIVCKRSREALTYKSPKPTMDTSEYKKRVRAYKTAFYRIPCHNQPVLRLNIRGHMLIHKSKRSKQERYMHCPRCGAFHKIITECWRLSDYACPDCVKKSALNNLYWDCAYCHRPINSRWKKFSTSEKQKWVEPRTFLDVKRPTKGSDPQDPFWDPDQNPLGVIQRLCFCTSHFNAAKHHVRSVDKARLWDLIGKNSVKKKIEYSSKYASGNGW